MAAENGRRTPEELLRQCEMEVEHESRKAHLKIILGYSSGVGKSFRVLDEARRRRERGQDVVIGAIQPRVPPEVADLLGTLQVIPFRKIGQGTAIDVGALVRRHPTVCFIDGLAYDNPPGARNATRWQDAEELLLAGIKVVGSINIQYIAELREQVEAITGKHVTETVPVSFIKSADEIEIVDATPEEPIEHTGRIEAKQREHTTPRANVAAMIETAQLIAERFHGEIVIAYVNQPDISPEGQAALEEKLRIARAAGACIEIIDGEDPTETILDFAHSRGITQLFIGHS